jgi:hypothetical protein
MAARLGVSAVGNQILKIMRQTVVMTRAILMVLAITGLASAQQPPPQPGQTSGSGPGSEPWRGMTVKEKLRYDAHHVLDAENIVFAGIGAAFDQARDRPAEWGEGWGPFAERYASHLGQYLVQRSIMYPVQAIDHEDTRYLRSTHSSYQARLGDAFLHTVWRRSDSGGMMPAYSEVLGDYGAAAVSRMWWPDHYHKASSILVAGSDTILIDGAINVFHEFKPDLEKWLHIKHY